jgi:hypothetical protein
MLRTVVLSFIAGFFGGNGLPYYVAGSTGEATNPSPFPDAPIVNVLTGCAGMAIAGACWTAADVSAHKRSALARRPRRPRKRRRRPRAAMESGSLGQNSRPQN